MIVEIRKAGFLNKGAELMLYAILDKMKREFPVAKFAMAPHPVAAPYEERIKLHLYQKPDIWRYRFQWGKVFSLIPRFFRKMYGVVLDREIDVVLDAAGFGYSDQQGRNASLGLANACKRWKKNGAKVILLPQAFGPFNDPVIRKSMKIAIENADIIFARDKISYDYLIDIAGERQTIRISPDYTNLIEGILPDDFDTINNQFCLIPNYRMIDKTSEDKSSLYIPFMIKCAQYLIKRGVKPFLLVHDGINDLLLAEEISKGVGGEIPIVKETHPLKIKGIIGASEGMVGSRFHGLVSALSQGVPALATGWSHKYEELFNDYDFPEGILNVTCNEQKLHNKLDMIINQKSQAIIKKTLGEKSSIQKQQSEMMWTEVFTLLNSKK